MPPIARKTSGRHVTLWLRALIIVVACGSTFARGELPRPPRQAEKWTPPATTLPRFLVSATAALFDQGLADPRGCEYRSIQVMAGKVWGGRRQIASTSGWVLPAQESKRPEYAITWSGLVYPWPGMPALPILIPI